MTKQDPLQLLADLTLRLQEEPDNADLLMQRGQSGKFYSENAKKLLA